jgi:hypothetical protein
LAYSTAVLAAERTVHVNAAFAAKLDANPDLMRKSPGQLSILHI